MPKLGMRESIGEDAQERLVLRLPVEPFKGIAMDEVGRVLRTLLIICAAGIYARMLNVLLQDFGHEVRVAPSLRVVAVQEIGEIAVCLELTDRTIKAIDAPEVG